MVAREGSIAAACERVHLAQPTVSSQIKTLERSLKARLSERVGHSLVMTETGRLVFRYAGEIFSLGRELQDAVASRGTEGGLRFVVGVADTVPKLMVHRRLEPALHMVDERVVEASCLDGDPGRLPAQLALHEIDLVISDYAAHPRLGLRAFNHLLGDCGVTFFAAGSLDVSFRRGFPQALADAPMLLPAGNAALRREVEQWFDGLGIRPQVRGESSDSALRRTFGARGEEIFMAASAVEGHVRRIYEVQVVGRESRLRERFYTISVEKRLAHPAVLAITRAARASLGGG